MNAFYLALHTFYAAAKPMPADARVMGHSRGASCGGQDAARQAYEAAMRVDIEGERERERERAMSAEALRRREREAQRARREADE